MKPRLPRPGFRRRTAPLLLALLLFPLALPAADFPPPDWREYDNPDADPRAQKGGSLTAFLGPYPKSLNYYLDPNVMSAEVFSLFYETLLSRNPATLEPEPFLADRWSISGDRLSYTFHLDPRARWSDGRPVTAADVAFTYAAVMDPANLTGPHKIGLSRFDPPEILDGATIRFTANEVHWENLLALGDLPILPAHAFQGLDFNLVNFEFPVVSGPYRLERLEEGLLLTLARRPDWWAAGLPRFRLLYNFDRLHYRFFEDRNNAYEAFLKGEIDVYPVYSAHIWETQTSTRRFLRRWIVKNPVRNRKPVGFQGIALNMRRPPLDDVRVRRALAHLFDRAKMNETLMFNAYFLHRSYYEDLYDPASSPCPNPLIPYDPDAARALLAEAGFAPDPATGLLRRGGRPLVLRYLSRGSTDDKFIAIFREDLKKVGISLEIDRKDWAAWSKDMDSYNYDMTWAAWSAGLYKDPESMWLSTEADRPSGQNITGFKDPEVDALVAAQRTIFDVSERHAIVRRIDAILADRVPYILLWNTDSTRLLHWNRFGMPPAPLARCGDESATRLLWWHDPDAEADLRHAMSTDRDLPAPLPVPAD